MDALLKILIAYLLGSVNGSLVVGRFYGGVDIRTQGSGNAGGTNALRTRGKLFALLVIIIDVGKAVLAVGLVPGLAIPGFGSGLLWPETVAALCASAAVAGHVWPVWHGFRGGKGVATLIGAFLVLALPVVGVMLATWVLTLILTGYVGLASILAALSAPLFILFSEGTGRAALLGFSGAMAALVIYTHRENIARLKNGTEHQFRKALLFRRT